MRSKPLLDVTGNVRYAGGRESRRYKQVHRAATARAHAMATMERSHNSGLEACVSGQRGGLQTPRVTATAQPRDFGVRRASTKRRAASRSRFWGLGRGLASRSTSNARASVGRSAGAVLSRTRAESRWMAMARTAACCALWRARARLRPSPCWSLPNRTDRARWCAPTARRKRLRWPRRGPSGYWFIVGASRWRTWAKHPYSRGPVITLDSAERMDTTNCTSRRHGAVERYSTSLHQWWHNHHSREFACEGPAPSRAALRSAAVGSGARGARRRLCWRRS